MSMNAEEKRLIEGLFTRLGTVEREAAPRDGEAEAFIQKRLSDQPAAPYYMAQTIIVQEQALEAAQERIRQLESQPQQGGGGLLGGLFGGGQRGQRAAEPSPQQGRVGGAMPAGTPWGGGASGAQAQPAPRQGGGFLAGAAQTAVGVAGGMMLGSMLGSMFGGAGDAIAGEVGNAADGLAEDVGMDGFDDGGGFDGFDDI
ncbi:DUF2076 domain-containing protein [Aureimonas altamirensis]|uniref:DUF2076 domain-containing protein n=1 Tax=Aureimonas altamirensis TaxID=370622 RepID=UPI001E551749|nr:DUF2076 domain-containing protein [Aureimonas altamirensis]UHD47385.1 DUF2076 domain-containing protein [Aureimonas altamirensis]